MTKDASPTCLGPTSYWPTKNGVGASPPQRNDLKILVCLAKGRV